MQLASKRGRIQLLNASKNCCIYVRPQLVHGIERRRFYTASKRSPFPRRPTRVGLQRAPAYLKFSQGLSQNAVDASLEPEWLVITDGQQPGRWRLLHNSFGPGQRSSVGSSLRYQPTPCTGEQRSAQDYTFEALHRVHFYDAWRVQPGTAQAVAVKPQKTKEKDVDALTFMQTVIISFVREWSMVSKRYPPMTSLSISQCRSCLIW